MHKTNKSQKRLKVRVKTAPKKNTEKTLIFRMILSSESQFFILKERVFLFA